MRIYQILISLVAFVIAQNSETVKIPAEEWLNKGDYGNFEKSVNLGKKFALEYFEQTIPGNFYSIVLPLNEAWEGKDDLYEKIKNGGDDELMNLFTLITVQTGRELNSLDDIDEGTTNLSGYSINHTIEDGEHKLEMGNFIGDTFQPLEERAWLIVDEKPLLKFNEGNLYGATQFNLPNI